MKKSSTSLLISSIILAMISCSEDTSEQKNSKLEANAHARYDIALVDKKEMFSVLPSKAENENNKGTIEKISLGQRLYFDKRLSKNNSISCNSCHDLGSFGVDNLSFSPGDRGENGGRNSPTVLNAALHSSQFWDGRAADVEEQAGMPILNPIEMDIPSKDFLVARLNSINEYPELFKKAFPKEPKPLTYKNIEKAIAAFERQLLTPSRFDDYLNGNNDALTIQEKKGMLSFVNIGCNSCHAGSLLGGQSLQKFGVYGDYWKATGSTNIDLGLFDITEKESDKYIFKVPSLRNIAHTMPYFHDGSVDSLPKAVEIMANLQLDYAISESEIANIVAFLNALTGKIPAEYSKDPFEL